MATADARLPAAGSPAAHARAASSTAHGRPVWRSVLNATVIVSALGYFVDIYDLLLFSIVRVPSLRGLGVEEARVLDLGIMLLNWQMAGLLVGGILWGILGDKRGRLSVLFGSIALYSVANIANAFVTSVGMYAGLRFVAGVGLAGELGAAVTLVSEVMTKETRGYGTAVVAGVGLLGAIVGALVASKTDWRTAYLIGGGLGLVLLVARISMRESGMYASLRRRTVARGDLRLLFATRERAGRYARCLLVGMPIWFVIGILVTFSPELAPELGVTGPIVAGTAVGFCYFGAAVGDFGSGALSQRLGSRRWVMVCFLGGVALLTAIYTFSSGLSPAAFYVLCSLLGVFAGYWAVFVTNAAEQFGTNLRATVTTTAPNFVRGMTVPITLAFRWLAQDLGLARAALVVGMACVLIAVVALHGLAETWGKDLDYVET